MSDDSEIDRLIGLAKQVQWEFAKIHAAMGLILAKGHALEPDAAKIAAEHWADYWD